MRRWKAILSIWLLETQRYFTEKLEAEEIQQRFKSTLHKNGAYPTNLRVKVQTKGACGARYWDKQKNMLKPFASHAGSTFRAKLYMKGVWFSNSSWGDFIGSNRFLSRTSTRMSVLRLNMKGE